MTRRFDIIGAPLNQLGRICTKESTVNALRQLDRSTWLGLSEWIDVRNSRWHADITDVGDVGITKEVQQLLDNEEKDQALRQYANELKHELLSSYRNGRIPVTLGGDHSIAVGTLQAVLEYHQKERGKKVAVIWVDAHADCNTSLVSNLHGKPLAIMMNKYPHNGWQIPVNNCLNPQDIYYVGVRDLMRNEFDLIQENGITNYDFPYIEQRGFNQAVDDLMTKLELEYDHIYLSFDYDVLDGSIFRACATPNVGGLTAREALHLVRTIAASNKFIGAEFVEYLPALDKKGISKELMIKLIDAVWGFYQ
ncbi:arginase family protein [Thaumasiovibrio sp. DFM-14]|uniref:arginase family protein n=1 Tax=Thaumasiovibrio sp. DFM-14 TaxID=3384792 RepID=UPI00399FAF17